MITICLKEFRKIDILVNNAAILIHGKLLEMSEEEWDRIIETNLKSVFLCSQAVAKEMIKNKIGKIINISALAYRKPSMKEGAYITSKAGILGLTKVLALELGEYGINVNAILPGLIDTDMVRKTFLTNVKIENYWRERTVFKRIGKPEDIAKVALFLVSSLSDFITGEQILVTGGDSMSQ